MFIKQRTNQLGIRSDGKKVQSIARMKQRNNGSLMKTGPRRERVSCAYLASTVCECDYGNSDDGMLLVTSENRSSGSHFIVLIVFKSSILAVATKR